MARHYPRPSCRQPRDQPRGRRQDGDVPAKSRLSLWSRGSLLSIASDSSVLSIGSVGSVLSVGSVGSCASAFSVGSSMSFGSALSWQSGGSVLSAESGRSLWSWQSRRAVAGRRTQGDLREQPAPALAVAALAGAALLYAVARRRSATG
jgi:hypothetical protein